MSADGKHSEERRTEGRAGLGVGGGGVQRKVTKGAAVYGRARLCELGRSQSLGVSLAIYKRRAWGRGGVWRSELHFPCRLNRGGVRNSPISALH